MGSGPTTPSDSQQSDHGHQLPSMIFPNTRSLPHMVVVNKIQQLDRRRAHPSDRKFLLPDDIDTRCCGLRDIDRKISSLITSYMLSGRKLPFAYSRDLGPHSNDARNMSPHWLFRTGGHEITVIRGCSFTRRPGRECRRYVGGWASVTA